MGRYATYDFTESIAGNVELGTIKQVHAAWGESEEGYGQWSGGFLCELTDGSFAYITGWCDTTGWGCQDGNEVEFYRAKPELDALKQSWGDTKYEWDLFPADLNLWIERGGQEQVGDITYGR